PVHVRARGELLQPEFGVPVRRPVRPAADGVRPGLHDQHAVAVHVVPERPVESWLSDVLPHLAVAALSRLWPLTPTRPPVWGPGFFMRRARRTRARSGCRPASRE